MSGRRSHRVCQDRCEVCDAVIAQRPVRELRRCADHLDQLELLCADLLRRKGSANTS